MDVYENRIILITKFVLSLTNIWYWLFVSRSASLSTGGLFYGFYKTSSKVFDTDKGVNYIRHWKWKPGTTGLKSKGITESYLFV